MKTNRLKSFLISIQFSEAQTSLETLPPLSLFNFMCLCPFFSSGAACSLFWLMSQIHGLVGPMEITAVSPDRPFFSTLIITLFSGIALLVPSYHLCHMEPCNKILTDRMENIPVTAESDGCKQLNTMQLVTTGGGITQHLFEVMDATPKSYPFLSRETAIQGYRVA